MTQSNEPTDLRALVASLDAHELDRRQFFANLAKLGIAGAAATALWQTGVSRAGATAAGSAAAPRFSLQDEKTLIVAIPQATVQLDPAVAGGNGYGDIIPINENIAEGLTRYNNGTAEIEPALAESWTVSDDGLTTVFKIREGVTFHDGTPLDAKAVETNFLRQLDPENPLHQDNFPYVEIVFAEVDTVAATGDYELTITLKRPIILLPANLAVFAGGIVSPTALETYGADYSDHAAGTGPFKFDSWTKDVELVLVANDDYWGGRPALDKVVFRTISDDTVRIAELTTGGIDVANQIDFKDVASVEGNPDLQLITGPFWNVQFLGFNQSVAPFDNKQFRQALQYAVNKQNISDAVFYGNYTLGGGPIAPGLLGYDESLETKYAFDPEQAKSLITESGVTELSFDLYNRTNSFWPILGQLVQADLAEVGVTVNLVSLEDAEFFDALNTAGKVGAFLNDWTWDNGDPDNIIYSLFASPRAETRLGLSNDQIIDLTAQAQTETDQATREDLYKQIQGILLDESVSVFFGYPSRAIGTVAGVTGLVLSPIGNIVLRPVDIA
jgi:peptide/nickel transport system substrate-binding protein